MAAGVAYVGLPMMALVWLRADATHGVEVLFWLFAVVWSADTGAYFFGRLIGGPRLAPVISPNKTWAGLIGGGICAGVAGLATAVLMDSESVPALALFSAGMGVVAQGGDLLESGIKRHFQIKDVSNLIPGHGGVMDRVDGLLAAAVATALAGLFGEGCILAWL